MRIAHVVTLVSDGGAYGGPVSVATAQLAELARRGHETVLLSLWSGHGPAPSHWDGVPLEAPRSFALIPGTGFLGLLNPRLLHRLWRCAGNADVVHVHAGRDLVSLSALAVAVLRRRRLVVQTHGMVQPRDSTVALFFDSLCVPLLRRARACLVLTEEEETGLARVLGPGGPPLHRVRNGVARPPVPASPGDAAEVPLVRPPLEPAAEGASVAAEPLPVAGQPDADLAGVDAPATQAPAAAVTEEPVRPGGVGSPQLPPSEVLFLARLHPVKRPEAFVEAAAIVAARRPGTVFTLHGADEGCLARVDRLVAEYGLAHCVRYAGPVSHEVALRRIAEASVYVLPSRSEVFPVSLLEALAAGTPTVCTRGCGIADELAVRGASLVTDGSPQSLADAVTGLLDNPVRARAIAEAGLRAVDEVYSAAAVADRLEELYRSA
jgi:glycosyltransferase involved in cell wall biosynthesis